VNTSFRLARATDFAESELRLEADDQHPQNPHAGLRESVIPADDVATCSP